MTVQDIAMTDMTAEELLVIMVDPDTSDEHRTRLRERSSSAFTPPPSR